MKNYVMISVLPDTRTYLNRLRKQIDAKTYNDVIGFLVKEANK